MVAKRQCSFCAQEIEPGTGTIFVKRDGTVFQFCSSSCRKQQLHLGRIGHRFKWTRAYELKRAAERSSAERTTSASAPAPPARAKGAAKPAAPPAAPASTAAHPAAEAKAPAAAEAPELSASPATKKPRTRRATKPSAKPASGATKTDADGA